MEFGQEHAQIKPQQVVAAEVASLDKAYEPFGNIAEPRHPGDVFIADVVNRGSFRRDGDARIDPPGAVIRGRFRSELQNADLNDAVVRSIGAGRFKIENGERPFKQQVLDHGPLGGAMERQRGASESRN